MWRSARPSPGWDLASWIRSPLRRMKVMNCSYSSSDRAFAMPGISPLTSVMRSSNASAVAWSTSARIAGWFIQSVAWLVVMSHPGVSVGLRRHNLAPFRGRGGDMNHPPNNEGAGPSAHPLVPRTSTPPLLRVGQPDALHPPGLGPRVEDAQGDDAARLLAGQRLPEIALGPDRLAFDRDDDVGTAALRVVEQHFPGGTARGHVGDDEAARVGRNVELLGRIGRDRLHADPEPAHGGPGGRVGVVAVAVLLIGGHLWGVVERLQLDVERLAHPAFPGHLDLDHVARTAEPDHLLQLANVLHRLAVYRHDDVARLDAGGLGRRIVARDVLDHHAPDLGQPYVRRVIQRHVVDRHAERRAVDLAVLDQLVHDGPREVDRNREAVARVEPGLAGDGGVDPDHLAPDTHQRTAGVARIDGGVGLDEVLDAALTPARQPAQRTALGAHDARGDGERQSLAQRVADGQYPL